jgi:hypothetical protein
MEYLKQKDNFDITIKDNFIEQKLYKSIYDKIPFYIYNEDYFSKLENKSDYLFRGKKTEKNIADYLRKKCEKLYNKKFKEYYTGYTMVARNTQFVHTDKSEDCTHQLLVYIRGDESLHRGTGFYVEKNGNHELNTHIGFKQNRAIFWESSTHHSPLIWSDDNKSVRFSIVAQYKERENNERCN